MKRQSVITQKKKRGPPATGKGELIGVRIHPGQMGRLDAWIASQKHTPSRPEAIRQLLEWALANSRPVRRRAERAAKASEMAGQEIDRLADPSATDEKRQLRKRKLTKGPNEFREMRNRARTKG
jgi:hypothetical protein